MTSPTAPASTPDRDAFHVYDTTLRDGAQREGISYSVSDKLAVARLLDQLGVGFIEGGWPGALPKDTEFFARARDELHLEHAQLVAFGSTRKAGVRVEDDAQVQALLDSGAPVITLVAKSDLRHVAEALRTTPEENLAMVCDTVAHLVAAGRRVFVDCEHFFDGYFHDPDYGVELLRVAAEAGMSVGVLCDTNGGTLPSRIGAVVADVRERSGVRIGIHCQDDTACAVANTIAAVEAGATHVQCTANGYGERTGNADLFAVVGNLELKLDMRVLPEGKLPEMVRVSHALADIANLPPNTHQAYVGVSAFAHKAGLHASALKVNASLYNHMDPELVGNDMRILVTEMAGRASVELKGRELGIDLSGDSAVLGRVVDRVKDLESQGWTFEAADASFELLLRDELAGERRRHFTVESWRTIVEQAADGRVVSEATVKVHAGGERIISTGEGNGPVNALDNALRAGLTAAFPELARLELVDYKVRILDGVTGTDAVTRVLVGTSDGSHEWTTTGVHENVIAASWLALEDAVAYGLLKAGRAAEASPATD
jgi:2-isopropylmalate synthase